MTINDIKNVYVPGGGNPEVDLLERWGIPGKVRGSRRDSGLGGASGTKTRVLGKDIRRKTASIDGK